MGKRIIYVIEALVAVLTLVGILWGALARLGDIDARIVGLLLIGASIGAGVLGFVTGVMVALRAAAIRRARMRAASPVDHSTPPQAALPGSDLPVVYTPPADVAAGRTVWSPRRVILWTFVPAVAAAIAGWALIGKAPGCEGADCGPRPAVTVVVTVTPINPTRIRHRRQTPRLASP
ncbi:MAG: hypothetical protein M3134_06815 [Actinomycetota bacterium]|nr:hypothetical protein [Actinomycetota bacterium]